MTCQMYGVFSLCLIMTFMWTLTESLWVVFDDDDDDDNDDSNDDCNVMMLMMMKLYINYVGSCESFLYIPEICLCVWMDPL